MRSLYSILLTLSVVLFNGCGGGGGSSTATSTNVSGYLIDSAISGVDYTCGSITGVTDSSGKFTCEKNSTVYFSIGNIILGDIIVSSDEEIITPAKLYNLEEDDISDSRVINFLQLIQSLDSDLDTSNGITISDETKTSVKDYDLDISDITTTTSDLTTLIEMTLGLTLVSKTDAIAHYIETLTTELNIEVGDYLSEPLIYQQWSIIKDDDFYMENEIDDDAHIHPDNIYAVYTGSGIKIAIIDNGFDVTHEDLDGSIINTYDLETGTTDVSHNESDENHGTAVSGIVAARLNSIGIKGVASNADLILIKYKDAQMSDSDFIELFNKAEEFGADIINCSWGTGFVSDAVREKIEDLAINGRDGKGISIVFSSGNDNQDMRNDEANIEEVISVGATDKDNLRTYYSDYGRNLDIVSPGGYYLGITTLDASGSNGTSNYDDNYLLFDDENGFTGTSASAPIVSGVIALMLEKDPDLTRVEIENLLKDNADKIGNVPYNSNERNNYYGYGKVNLSATMEKIK